MTRPTLVKQKLGRTIHWSPVDDAYFRVAAMLRTSRTAADIGVSQRVLEGVEAQCREAQSPIVYGLLTGKLCVDPKTGHQFIHIDGATPGSDEAEGQLDLSQRLRGLTETAAQVGTLVVGWYRGGSRVPPAKSRENVAIHRSLFSEPWTVALIIESGSEPLGRFVRMEPSDGRAYTAPFLELVAEGHRGRSRQTPTVVQWANYHADTQTVYRKTVDKKTVAPVAPTGHQTSQGSRVEPNESLAHHLRSLVTAVRTKLQNSPPTAGHERTPALPSIEQRDANFRNVVDLRTMDVEVARQPICETTESDVAGVFPILVPARGGTETRSWRPALLDGISDLAERLTNRRP